MIFNLLQKTVPADTAELNKIEQTARSTIEHIATTPLDELLPELLKEAINFGIKVLIALLIYFIGAWLIKKIRNMLHRIFERRNTEKAIASFVESLTSISLMVILVIITVGTLGINTTSLAALLAAGGMAIGMALSGTVQNFAGGIMLLLIMLVIGAVIGNASLLGFMAYSKEAADLYGILISYPLMFIPAMLFAAYQSRKNEFFEGGIMIDSNNFGNFSGASIAIAVSVATLAAAFALDFLNVVMPPMPEPTAQPMRRRFSRSLSRPLSRIAWKAAAIPK